MNNRNCFSSANTPSLRTNGQPANGHLTPARRADGTMEYTWTWPNGRRLHFNNWGKLASDAAPAPRGAWFYHRTGLPLAQLQCQANGGATNRRTVYNSDKRPVAVYDNGKLMVLNDALRYLGYSGIDMTYGKGADAYFRKIAKKNRGDALNMLNPADYVSTTLPRGTAPLLGKH